MLKNKIQSDFIAAMKARDDNAKRALSSLKSKITEAEKLISNQPLTDDEVVNVIVKAIKQRNQSVLEYRKWNRPEAAEAEEAEIDILSKYLPKQLTEDEIRNELVNIMSSIKTEDMNHQKLIGLTMGTFTKKFKGKADSQIVMKIINNLIK